MLSDEQENAIDFVISEIIHNGKKITSIKGLAGTGKTTLIAPLRQSLQQRGYGNCYVGAPTNRAAHVLRKKGVNDAQTIYRLAMKPIYEDEYQNAINYLNSDDNDSIPTLLLSTFCDLEKIIRDAREYSAEKALSSIGIHSKDYLLGFGPKEASPGEILIVDESSMIGSNLLAICQRAFNQVIFVGDPGQLPPVKDTSAFWEMKGITLNKIHRQAEESEIILAAHHIRNGNKLNPSFSTDRDILLTGEIAPNDIGIYPVIVWTNRTRINATNTIRKRIGYDETSIMKHEPLVCRSTDRDDKVEGFYNNSLWRIDEVISAREAIVINEDNKKKQIKLHMEEIDGDNIPVDSIPFRFGYFITAHTAQGSEWDRVYIHMRDYRSLCEYSFHTGMNDLPITWAYTAITRASNTLLLLQ